MRVHPAIADSNACANCRAGTICPNAGNPCALGCLQHPRHSIKVGSRITPDVYLRLGLLGSSQTHPLMQGLQ